MLGTNPFAFGWPRAEAPPYIFDFATSVAARGEIELHRRAGTPIPEGWAVDADGRPTTDPQAYFDGGALLPMAGPKGYGMALVAELLGEAISAQARDGMNWIAIAVDLSRFRLPGAYREAAEACLQELRECPPAPGFERVEIPGEREAALRQQRLRAGIPMPPQTLRALCRLGARLGVDPQALEAADAALAA